MMKLYQLVKKNYNGSTSIVVDNMIDNLLELLLNAVLIHRNDYPNLAKYLKTSDHRYSVLEEAMFEIANSRLRDA